ncbi:lysozyme g-like isoform X1 [Xiphophorus hellerii]|uniref:lysozyme g-like isoform X1 n=2 Tax=Xiphophorus hellerii TaxID=8084 RepID=UPI0013B35FA8|nr:lysozyme g-like isoform X1 [Xiphophorus hellerii]
MFTGYGDINRVEASGASEKTSQQDRLGYFGVRASETMAQTDSGRMNKYKSKINRVGSQSGIDPALIAAIISRESRAGNVLHDGWGDHGNAWGLMQVDIRHHHKEGDWDSEEHLRQATGILVHFIKRIQNKFPNWSKEQQLKGGIAAYNMGDGNVHSYENVDEKTTGKDYSNDVVARAKWYKRNGF